MNTMIIPHILVSKPLKQFPILCSFIDSLFKKFNLYEAHNVLKSVKDYKFFSYLISKEHTIRIYLVNDSVSFLKLADEYKDVNTEVKIYKSENGLLAIEVCEDGDIDIYALENECYLFEEELQSVFMQETSILDLMYKDKENVEVASQATLNMVDDFFDAEAIQFSVTSMEWDNIRYKIENDTKI